MSASNCSGVLLMWLVLVSVGTLSEGFTRRSCFKSINGFKNAANIIDTFHVSTTKECTVSCVTRHNCDSYNLAQTDDASNMRECQLVNRGNYTVASAAPDWDMFVGKCICTIGVMLCPCSQFLLHSLVMYWRICVKIEHKRQNFIESGVYELIQSQNAWGPFI